MSMYKKLVIGIVIVAVTALIVLSVGYMKKPVAKSDADLSAYLEEQIMEHHRGGYLSGAFCCADVKVLGTEKNKDETTVYAWVLYMEYDEVNGEVENVSGAHVPTVITVKKGDADSEYELVEYWEPRDGSDYAADIMDRFPLRLQEKALDPQTCIDEQRSNCDRKAQDYFASVSNVDGADGP